MLTVSIKPWIVLHFVAKLCVGKIKEVWNSRVTKSSYEVKLSKMTSKFELLTQKFVLVITCLRGKFGINLSSSLF